MNLFETEKLRFSLKWWNELSHHFKEDYMSQIYTKIGTDIKRGYKVLPSSKDIYQRFNLINPDDVKVVFLTNEPICSYKQSKEWQLLSCQIEQECFDGLHLNLEDNLDYTIKDGVISISPSLTVCNKSDHSDIGWLPFVLCIMDILQNTGNKIIFVCQKDLSLDIIKSRIISNNITIDLENGCFSTINSFMQKEYNTKISW